MTTTTAIREWTIDGKWLLDESGVRVGEASRDYYGLWHLNPYDVRLLHRDGMIVGVEGAMAGEIVARIVTPLSEALERLDRDGL